MKHSFSISPRILFHLGEDLIKNESIALLELVKNSYDACAKKCSIDFHFKDHQLTRITIEDNGFGMNSELIENVWLKVGTDFKFKKIEPNSCGRIPLGEKGIGRLGVHKLGNKITLISKKRGSKEVELFIDWNDLPGAESIDDFKIEVNESPSPEVFKTGNGTKIIIEDLKAKWDRRELREVYRNLNSLNSPFSEKNEAFELEITSNSDFFEGLPSINDIKESAMYHGHCKMVGDKITEFKYEFKPWKSLTKVDVGRTKKLHELLPVERKIIDKDGNPIDLNSTKIGPIEFDILIFEMDSQVFSLVNAEKKSIKDYLRENGGVRVYRDDVRVYDYGERDNDWLGIDLRRVHRVGGNVSNNIIIGAVKLNRADSLSLREKSNREGFIENKLYFSFVEAVNYALSLIVKERNVDKQLLTTLYKKYKVIEPVLSDLNEVIELVEKKVDDGETKVEILTYLSRINDQYREVKSVLIKSANAGLNLSVVIHEMEKVVSQLTGAIERNESEKATRLSLMLEKIVRGYSAMIKSSQIKKDSLSEVVEIAIDNYQFRWLDHKIKVLSNWKESNLEAYFAKAETISVITNLLDNAIFWLSYARKEDRVISIFITDQIKIEGKQFNSIIVSDNGPGFNIPPEVAVKPFMSGKPHSIGSGLGLHVANEMMAAMKGKLDFLDKDEIKFPKEVVVHGVDKTIIALCFPTEK
jgi:anti-sigma regulatory factor (Ser/Thr protein kinase)